MKGGERHIPTRAGLRLKPLVGVRFFGRRTWRIGILVVIVVVRRDENIRMIVPRVEMVCNQVRALNEHEHP